MSDAEFEDLVVKFNCKNNPMTSEPIELKFTANEFVELSPD